MQFPCLGLLLSGGNSAIYRLDGLEQMQLLVDTTDDALGEAFDKCASVLDLGYPGGPAIEKAALRFNGDANDLLLPAILKELKPLRFSFSGIKTAVLRSAREGAPVDAIAYSFQERCFELVERVLRAALLEWAICRADWRRGAGQYNPEKQAGWLCRSTRCFSGLS